MTASTGLSLAKIIEVVGPSILSFLTEKDILCSLQYASSNIWYFISSTSQVWREFIHRYFIGSTLQQEVHRNLKTLSLITSPKSDLVPLDEIPNDVLYSIIAGIFPAKYIEQVVDSDSELFEAIKKDLKYRISPFNQLRSFLSDWDTTTTIYLQLYWSGQWGIFGR